MPASWEASIISASSRTTAANSGSDRIADRKSSGSACVLGSGGSTVSYLASSGYEARGNGSPVVCAYLVLGGVQFRIWHHPDTRRGVMEAPWFVPTMLVSTGLQGLPRLHTGVPNVRALGRR